MFMFTFFKFDFYEKLGVVFLLLIVESSKHIAIIPNDEWAFLAPGENGLAVMTRNILR